MRVTMRAVCYAACELSGLPLAVLIGQQRQAHIVRFRQAAQYLCVRRCGKSWPETGRLFHRDHTTVLWSLRAIETRLAKEEADGETALLLEAIWNLAREKQASGVLRINRDPEADAEAVEADAPQPEDTGPLRPLRPKRRISRPSDFEPYSREWWRAYDDAFCRAMKIARERAA